MVPRNYNEKFYDRLRKNEWKNIASFGPSAQTRYRIFLKLIKKYNFKFPLLDCGCGTGELVGKISKKYQNYQKIFGFDFSEEAIRICRKKFPHLKFFKMNILNPNLEYKNYFNTIICSEVLEHIKNLPKAIKNLNLLLKNNGFLFISVPYQMKYWTRHDDFSGHIKRFEREELEKLLQKENFKILEKFSWGWLIYNVYYWFLQRINPKKAMKTRGKNLFNLKIKRILSYLFYLAFKTEYIIRDKDCKRGRRLFIVCQKIR